MQTGVAALLLLGLSSVGPLAAAAVDDEKAALTARADGVGATAGRPADSPGSADSPDSAADDGEAGDASAAPEVPVWNPPQAIRRVRTGGIAAPLPEGIVLVRVVGEMRPGALERSWTFEPDEPEGSPRRTIAVLPSAAVETAAARLAELGDGARLRVELTGTVQLHRGRNFILAGMITPLETPRRSGVRSQRAPDADAADADEIERRLRERLGPVPRGTDVSGPMADATSVAGSEGRILRRRGTVRRDDETGGWRFVPESELSGFPGATMGLLPCRMLERIERIARLSDTPRTLLLSGELVRFGDRVFLLPTALESPRTGRSLRPGAVINE